MYIRPYRQYMASKQSDAKVDPYFRLLEPLYKFTYLLGYLLT